MIKSCRRKSYLMDTYYCIIIKLSLLSLIKKLYYDLPSPLKPATCLSPGETNVSLRSRHLPVVLCLIHGKGSLIEPHLMIGPRVENRLRRWHRALISWIMIIWIGAKKKQTNKKKTHKQTKKKCSSNTLITNIITVFRNCFGEVINVTSRIKPSLRVRPHYFFLIESISH